MSRPRLSPDLVDAGQDAGAGLSRGGRHLEAMKLAGGVIEYQIGERPADVGSEEGDVLCSTKRLIWEKDTDDTAPLPSSPDPQPARRYCTASSRRNR
jgi:hypothetical protein